MTGFLSFLAGFLPVASWAAFTQVMGRRQLQVHTTRSPEDARLVVLESFVRVWTQVDGLGADNFRPRMRKNPPIISVAYQPAEDGGCIVSIWVSEFSIRSGFMLRHAQLCWRKKRFVARRLLRAQSVPANAA